MKIIETRSAPNPRRVRMFLTEKGITVPFEQVDLMGGALQSDEFKKLNPYQRVPVLILDDGTVISETMAICRYFEEIYPAPSLMGTTPIQKAIIEMWNRRIELGLFQSITHVFRHLHPKMGHLEIPQIKEWGEANRPKVLEHLQFLDEQLDKNRYISGDEFSVADITGFVAISFMKPAKLELPQEFKKIEEWYHRISLRPSASA
ncbi:MAG: glutathione S-transferase family protein [Hyphomicrobium sp.]